PILTALPSQDMPAPLKPVSAYAQQLAQRDIFNFAATSAEMPQNQNATPGQLPANLKIVGVLVGHPSEVIIEDTQPQQTYFLKEGEASGPFKILRVSKESVGLEYQGQSFEVSP